MRLRAIPSLVLALCGLSLCLSVAASPLPLAARATSTAIVLAPPASEQKPLDPSTPAPSPSGTLPSDDSGGYYIPNLGREKWIGLGLAISSSLAIGTSFIITKKGLIDAGDAAGGLASEQHAYLANPIWWAGMACMVIGEIANFAAYTFAPPILVTPLGALSVLIGAVLASFILKEDLGRLGRIGCTLCLVGTLIIILNAPEDKEIRTVDEMLEYATQIPFLTYCVAVSVFAVFMIWKVVPVWGKRTPLVYISICSSVGSISVMSVKAFGLALKLTLNGNNQFTHVSTYCFGIIVVGCIMVQMNYFNKALDQFSTNVVNPIYYVAFTTSTIVASFLLFRGFNTQGAAPALSLICGFVVIFMGVYLLNMNRLYDPITEDARMSLVTGEGVPAGRASQQWGRPMAPASSRRPGHAQRPSWSRNLHARTESATSASIFDAATDDEADFGAQEQVDLRPLARGPGAGRGGVAPKVRRPRAAAGPRTPGAAAASPAPAPAPAFAIAEEDELRTSMDTAPAQSHRGSLGLDVKGTSRAHLLSDVDGENDHDTY